MTSLTRQLSPEVFRTIIAAEMVTMSPSHFPALERCFLDYFSELSVSIIKKKKKQLLITYKLIIIYKINQVVCSLDRVENTNLQI